MYQIYRNCSYDADLSDSSGGRFAVFNSDATLGSALTAAVPWATRVQKL